MDIKNLVSQMTLEEKASLCSGAGFWHTEAIERLGVPSITMTDGPHGLRKQKQGADHLGIYESVPATCFPAACATACSFDEELLVEMGKALARECVEEDVSIILGPGTNIKRSPLCGRNFEYFSEDPYLATKLSAAHINGVQSLGIGTSLKHYAANNQESYRMTVDAIVDERTLREIYLASFEGAVKEAKPATVMCAYNKVNGEYAGENKYLLTDILRDEWGFDGYVVSDWGAVNDRVKGLKAGLELEMPTSRGGNDARIVQAVQSGQLKESVLDQAVARLLKITFETQITADKKANNTLDMGRNNEIARKVATESIVLLKNDDYILPLPENKKIAFVGEFFENPRYQGGGSSHVNPYKLTSAKDEISTFPKANYAQGFYIKQDETCDTLLAEAVKLAKESEICVIFAGLPDRIESEGYDRKHMRLPENQLQLISEIVKIQPNCVVVLHNGSPIEMPWLDNVKGLVEAYLAGQATGGAIMDILSGKVNPSGKLAETFPLRLQDNPSYLNFPGDSEKVEYREGLFVGYRYYDKKEMPVLFPFGYGLSYTTFEYSSLTFDKTETTDADIITASVKIKNTGTCAGKEIVQLYVASKCNKVVRPIKELKGFTKVALNPGEEKTVSFVLNKRSFAFYDVALKDWRVEGGTYGILIGASSQDIRLEADITITPAAPHHSKLTINTPMAEIMAHPKGMAALQLLGDVSKLMQAQNQDNGMSDMMEAMRKEIPLRAVANFMGKIITQEELDAVLG